MKISKVRQFRVIEAESAFEFETILNATMIELASCNPEIEVEFKTGYKALINYEVKKEIPESIRDQFAMQGISYKCANCPNCVRFTNADGTVDKRKKRGACNKTEFGHCLIEGEACEWFYEAVSNGEIEVVEG